MNQLMRDLYATVCRCTAPKSDKKLMCDACYLATPPDTRGKLYSGDVHERQVAYESAIEHLQELGRVPA